MFSINDLVMGFILGYLASIVTYLVGGWFMKIESWWLYAKWLNEEDERDNLKRRSKSYQAKNYEN